jgi:uncharacterized protein YbcI
MGKVGEENLFREMIGQRIARAARVSERRQSMHWRDWVAVFLNEDTIVVALHGFLTDGEKAQLQSLAGAARVREFHQQLFANDSAILFQRIKRLTGMEVRNATVEFELMTGCVVHLITTDMLGEEFLFAIDAPVESRWSGHGPRRWNESSDRLAPTKPLDL